MVTLGIDAHKWVNRAVAVDEHGRVLDQWQGRNVPAAWQALRDWARQWDERRWGIEGTGSYGHGLAQHLVAQGEEVYEVNPRLTAELRRRARKQDKSDALDAQAIARAVLREGAALPAVFPEDETAAVLDTLTRERDRLQSQMDRLRNQLHYRLFQIDPEYPRRTGGLGKRETLQALTAYAPAGARPVVAAQAASVRRLAASLLLVLEQLEEVTGEIEQLGAACYPALTQLSGVGKLTAGKLAGVLGSRQFTSPAGLAAYGGVAPLEASSAGGLRHRLNRGGNRRLNSILYMVALSQWTHRGPGRWYIERRMSEGKTWREAVRALKRYLAQAVWRLWRRHYVSGEPVGSRGGLLAA